MRTHRQAAKPSSESKIGTAKRSGLLVILSSPSGGGKTTIAQKLLRRDLRLVRSVSCTTRKPRPGEVKGKDYFFITKARFKSMIARKAFLEWARVHRNYYGTPLRWVRQQLTRGKDVLFVIDVQGGKTIKNKQPNAVLVFLKPPTFGVLKRRLLGRKSEAPADLKVRLEDAKWELKEGRHYDHQVVNDRLTKAVLDVARIIQRERKSRV